MSASCAAVLAQDSRGTVPPPATRPAVAPVTQPAASAPATSAPASAPATRSAVASPQEPTAKAAAGTLRVSGKRVNVRAKPDTSSLVVTKVDTDMMLQATGKQYGWYQIIPPPGVFAYASARFISKEPDGTGKVTIDSGNLRVRAGSTVFPTEDPEKSNDIIALLPAGATVRIIDQQGDWLKIAPPEGVRLYVDGRYVKPVGEDIPDTGGAGATPTAGSDVTTPSSSSAPAGSPWMQRLTAIEAAMLVEGGKDQADQNWLLITNELLAISRQTDDAAAAAAAATDLVNVNQREGGSTGTTAPEPANAPISGERMPRLPTAAPGGSIFTAVGQLEPAFALPNGPFGLRYKLIDPYSRSVNSYVEFPPEANIDATRRVGEFVGVRGDRKYLRESGVTIVTAYELTTITKEQATTRPARGKP